MAIDFAELERLRADFAAVRGAPFQEFFCPILLEDSVGPRGLINGHILNQAITGASRATVIQRADVDNYFGETIEPDLILGLDHPSFSNKTFFDRAHKAVAFGRSGKGFKLFVPEPSSNPPHEQIHLRDSAGTIYASPYVKAPLEEFNGVTEIQVETLILFRESAVVGSLLKAAYLCLFKTMGYKIVDDPLLNVVRQTLCDFVRDAAPKDKAASYFGEYRAAIQFLANGPLDKLPDSLTGHHFLFHYIDDITPDMLFALSCIFRLCGRTIHVMLPASRYLGTNLAAIRCYRQFLEDRDWPQVIRIARWVNDGWQVFDSPIRCTYKE